MRILTTPWKDDLMKFVRDSQESIKITSPFIKNNVCKELLSNKSITTKFEVITSFKLKNIYTGALDLAAIENILNNNGVVKNYPKVHSKIYIFDNKRAVISSGNLTNGGLINNFEYGVLIEDRSIILNISKDFNKLSTNENTGIIKLTDIDTIKKIISKIPKEKSIDFSECDNDNPENAFDTIHIGNEPIETSLTGWKLDVFKCVSIIQNQVFSLKDIYTFESALSQLHPDNYNIKDKIRQQLQILRDLGLIEFLGKGSYKKLWK